MWLKVHKTYRGGESNFDYIQIDDNDDKEECAKDWAEKSPGGHNYGWKVFWEEVQKPPEQWLNKAIVSADIMILAAKEYKAMLETFLK